MTFRYTDDDLFRDISKPIEVSTKFDELFESKWRELHKKGVFRYKLKIRGERVLPGDFGFFLQLNRDRIINRRTPEKMTSVKQPFDDSKFNFSKILANEYMFDIINYGDYRDDSRKHAIIINASPICYGHSLFCPDLEGLSPQIITLESIVMVLEIMFLTSNRNLRIGFNSLCGMASVNHLHYHILIVNFRLPVESSKCVQLNGPLYEMEDYPAKCFCFQIQKKYELPYIADQVFKLTDFLTRNNIAHNLYFTRGDCFDRPIEDAIRILVWVRKNSFGVKETTAFNLAVCEFSGQFIVKTRDEYEKLTEEDITPAMKSMILPIFESVKQHCINLYD